MLTVSRIVWVVMEAVKRGRVGRRVRRRHVVRLVAYVTEEVDGAVPLVSLVKREVLHPEWRRRSRSDCRAQQLPMDFDAAELTLGARWSHRDVLLLVSLLFSLDLSWFLDRRHILLARGGGRDQKVVTWGRLEDWRKVSASLDPRSSVP